MRLVDALIACGNPDILSKLEFLAKAIGKPYSDETTAALISILWHCPLPDPDPPMTGTDFVALAEKAGWDVGDDEDEEGVDHLPLTKYRYVKKSKLLIEALGEELVGQLQAGSLRAFALRSEDLHPVEIPQGNWFSMDVDWFADRATFTETSTVYHSVEVREDRLPEDNFIPDTEHDLGASTKPFVEEFFRRVARGQLKMKVSSRIERQLRTWGRDRGLPVPTWLSIRPRILGDERFKGQQPIR